jgi:hypothetical protein
MNQSYQSTKRTDVPASTPVFLKIYIFIKKNECISVHHLNPDLMFTQFASTHTCPHLNIVFS